MTQVLEFTGNWFIDLGILGFVNLMEEVYGWDLKELVQYLTGDFEKAVFTYFPLGYLFYHSQISAMRKEISSLRRKIQDEDKKRTKMISEFAKLSPDSNEKERAKVQRKIDKIQNKLEDMKENLSKMESNLSNDKQEFKEKVFDKDLDLRNLRKLIPDFNLIPPPYNRNFYLFNSKEMKRNIEKSFKYLVLLLKGDINELSKFKPKELSYEIYPDSTINPFLFSQNEFPNISYNLPHPVGKLNEFMHLKLPLYLLLLTFYNAFYFINRRSIVFYTNNLEISYNINKKLRLLSQKLKRRENLFKITWRAIIDQLMEEKAHFSLEHLYLIEYTGISNQKLINVEYIGVPKLQAELLIDDNIRDKLNNNIVTKASEQKTIEMKWLIEEFIKNNPLLPSFLQNLTLFLNNTIKNIDMSALIYGAALDKVLAELNSDRVGTFSDNFFHRSKSVLEKAKHTVRLYFSSKYLVNEIFSEELQDNRKVLAYRLFSRLRRNQKYPFVNELLKKLNEHNGKDVEPFIRHIFENILPNDKTWQSDAIPIIAGLIDGAKGGEE